LPNTAARTRFVADAMLGSLARKLRALGFDTTYFKSGTDSAILGIAAHEGRIILTSDRLLAARASSKLLGVILLAGTSDAARLGEIAATARKSGLQLAAGAPLCSLCGGDLEQVGRAAVSGVVPQMVEDRHRLFFMCRSCGQIYWKGGHWKKLRSLARRLRAK